MKVGGSRKVFDDFIETGIIQWPTQFDIVKFDETFTYGKRLPQDGTKYIYLQYFPFI